MNFEWCSFFSNILKYISWDESWDLDERKTRNFYGFYSSSFILRPPAFAHLFLIKLPLQPLPGQILLKWFYGADRNKLLFSMRIHNEPKN